jgi:hypothetical protein
MTVVTARDRNQVTPAFDLGCPARVIARKSTGSNKADGDRQQGGRGNTIHEEFAPQVPEARFWHLPCAKQYAGSLPLPRMA